jgi:hypothetical protein
VGPREVTNVGRGGIRWGEQDRKRSSLALETCWKLFRCFTRIEKLWRRSRISVDLVWRSGDPRGEAGSVGVDTALV